MHMFLLQARLSGKPVSRAHTFACREELEWPQKLFHDRSPRKYGTRPGLNLGPLDLQVRHVTDCAMWPGPGYKTIKAGWTILSATEQSKDVSLCD